MKKIISLQYLNRYNSNIYLSQVKDKTYKLDSTDKDDLQYLRIIYNNDKSIYAVDPSGGPFLSIDSKIENNIISKIIYQKPDILIEFK